MVLVICSTVLAANTNVGNKDNLISPAKNTTTKTQIQEEASKVVGLENAILRVKNEEQKKHLEQVMAKIQAKRMEQLNKLSELKVEIENVSEKNIISGKSQANFFGFKVTKTYKYEINNETGELVRQKSWVDNFVIDDSAVITELESE